MDDYTKPVEVRGKKYDLTITQVGSIWKAQGYFKTSLITAGAGQTPEAAIDNWKMVVEGQLDASARDDSAC
jgi:hypothetical protein